MFNNLHVTLRNSTHQVCQQWSWDEGGPRLRRRGLFRTFFGWNQDCLHLESEQAVPGQDSRVSDNAALGRGKPIGNWLVECCLPRRRRTLFVDPRDILIQCGAESEACMQSTMQWSFSMSPARWRGMVLGWFGTGLSALLCLLVWWRAFSLIFGHTVAAHSIILGCFLGSLATGSLIGGRNLAGNPNPFRILACRQGFIALFAALTPLLWGLVRHAYRATGGITSLGIVGGSAVQGLLAALVLGPPALFMGGFLRAAVEMAGVTSSPEQTVSQRHPALFYGASFLGAAVGVGLGTFVLLEHLGNWVTLWTACAVNGLLALAAWKWSSVEPGRAPDRLAHSQPPTVEPDSNAPLRPSVPRPLVAVGAVATGTVGFVMGLVWYRLLIPLLGNTVFAPAIVFTIMLAGIGLGSVGYALRARPALPSLAKFAWVLACQAALIAVPYALGDRLAVLSIDLIALDNLGFIAQVGGGILVTSLIVLPASVLIGVQCSVLGALPRMGPSAAPYQNTRAFGWTLAGAAMGAAMGGLGLLPRLTAPGCWRGMVLVLDLVLVIVLAVQWPREPSPSRRLATTLPSLAIAGVSLWLITAMGPTALWRHTPIGARQVTWTTVAPTGRREFANARRRCLVQEVEGREANVGLIRDAGYVLMMDGQPVENVRAEAPTQIMAGLLPALVHPQPKRSLVIGLGSGATAGWLGRVPGMERVDVLEIEPAFRPMAEACAAVNAEVLANPRVRLRYGDPREFMLTARETYDLIIAKAAQPGQPGTSRQFTREFYRAAARHLQPHGLFAQRIGLRVMDGATVSGLYATLATVFPFIETWMTQSSDLLLVASLRPVAYDVADMRRRLHAEPFAGAVARLWRVTDLEGVFARYLANYHLAYAVTAAQPPVGTDDRNHLEFDWGRRAGRTQPFALNSLRELAQAQGCARPDLRNGQLNRDVIWDRLASTLVLDHHFVDAGESEDEPFRKRLAAKAAFQALTDDFSAVADEWEGQAQEPGDLLEVLILAMGLADRGDVRALRYGDQLRPWFPGEADAVRARFLWHENALSQVADELALCLETWKTDPWSHPKLMEETFKLTSKLAAQTEDEFSLALIGQTLKTPFALGLLDQQRSTIELAAARRLDYLAGTKQTLQVMAGIEPYVPWNLDFLALRAQVYQQADDPRAGQAKRDFEQLQSAISRPFCFAPRTSRDHPEITPAQTHQPPPRKAEKVHARERKQADAPPGKIGVRPKKPLP